jgi:hypothetical protein
LAAIDRSIFTLFSQAVISVNVYDALSLELKRKVPVPGRVLSIESLSSSAPLAVVTNDAGDVSVYNLRTGALHAELPTVKVLCLSLS